MFSCVFKKLSSWTLFFQSIAKWSGSFFISYNTSVSSRKFLMSSSLPSESGADALGQAPCVEPRHRVVWALRSALTEPSQLTFCLKLSSSAHSELSCQISVEFSSVCQAPRDRQYL